MLEYRVEYKEEYRVDYKVEYRGYTGSCRLDDDEGVLRGWVVNTRDVVTFQGKTVEEARQAFCDSIDGYIEFCKELGRPPEVPRPKAQ